MTPTITSIVASAPSRGQAARASQDGVVKLLRQGRSLHRRAHGCGLYCRSGFGGIENPFPPPRIPATQPQPTPQSPSRARHGSPSNPQSSSLSPSSRRIRKRQQLVQSPKWPSLSRRSTAIWTPQPAPPPPPVILPPPPPRSPRRSFWGGSGFGSPGGDPRWALFLLAAIAASLIAATAPIRAPSPSKKGRASRGKVSGTPPSSRPISVSLDTDSKPAPRAVPVFRLPGELEKRMGYVLHMTEEEAKRSQTSWATAAVALLGAAAGAMALARWKRDHKDLGSSANKEDIQEWLPVDQSSPRVNDLSSRPSTTSVDAVAAHGCRATGSAAPLQGPAPSKVRSVDNPETGLAARHHRPELVTNAGLEHRQLVASHQGGGSATSTSGHLLDDSTPEITQEASRGHSTRQLWPSASTAVDSASLAVRPSPAQAQRAKSREEEPNTADVDLQPLPNVSDMPVAASGSAAVLPQASEKASEKAFPGWESPQLLPSEPPTASPPLAPQRPCASPMQPVHSHVPQAGPLQMAPQQLQQPPQQQPAAVQAAQYPLSTASNSRTPQGPAQQGLKSSEGSQSIDSPASGAKALEQPVRDIDIPGGGMYGQVPDRPKTPPAQATISSFEQMKSFWREQQTPVPSPQADITERPLSRHTSADSSVMQAYVNGRNASSGVAGVPVAAADSPAKGGAGQRPFERSSLTGSLVSATSELMSPHTPALGPGDLTQSSSSPGQSSGPFQNPNMHHGNDGSQPDASLQGTCSLEHSQECASPPYRPGSISVTAADNEKQRLHRAERRLDGSLPKDAAASEAMYDHRGALVGGLEAVSMPHTRERSVSIPFASGVTTGGRASAEPSQSELRGNGSTSMPATHTTSSCAYGSAAIAEQAQTFGEVGAATVVAVKADDASSSIDDACLNGRLAALQQPLALQRGALNSAAELRQRPFETSATLLSGSSGTEDLSADAPSGHKSRLSGAALHCAVGGGGQSARLEEDGKDGIGTPDSMDSGSPTFFSFPHTQKVNNLLGTLMQQGST